MEDYGLSKVPGWEQERALSFSTNGMEGVWENIGYYLTHTLERRTAIENAFSQKNYDEYVVYIHGTKGTLALIGFTGLSTLAAGLEQGGKNREFKYIKDSHNDFVSKVDDMNVRLRECYERYIEAEKKPIKVSWTPGSTCSVEANALIQILEKLKNTCVERDTVSMYKFLEECFNFLFEDGYCEYKDSGKENIIIDMAEWHKKLKAAQQFAEDFEYQSVKEIAMELLDYVK